MSIFEICMVVMAASTVTAALTTVAKNLTHAAGIKKAEKLAAQAGAGAAIGAALGAALESFINSNAELRAKTAEKETKEILLTLKKMKEVLDRQEHELSQARRPPAKFLLWLKAQLPKKGDA